MLTQHKLHFQYNNTSVNLPVKSTINYREWNDKIAEHFFKPEMAGRTVYLYVTEKLIRLLGQDRDADLQDFIKAVKTGPPKVTGNNICEKASNSMDYWKYRCGRRGYPLYIAYLALFVLAAGIEGDFSSKEYYRRLWTLLGEESKSGQYPDFNQMWELWDDLERWANEDKSGELGIFNVKMTGSLVHVGRPIAQTLLTEEELKSLPVIFAEADLDPSFPPSEGAIASLLAKHGRNDLRNRTLRLLAQTGDGDELRLALIERIIDELRAWDGTADLSSIDGTQVYGALRLCCQLDQIAGRATMTLRCSTKHEFPEDNLFLGLEGNSDSFCCEEYGNGSSSPIKSELNGKNIDASKFDWCQGLRMQSADKKWCFKLPASPIRVFIKGDSQGLPGLVEVRQLPCMLPFYLVAHEKCCTLLEKWGEASCQGFEKLPIVHGLPSGWHFFKAAAAYSDEIVKREYPILSLPTTVRLDLEGGIRLDRGHRFFKFAPPKLVLQGSDESVKVYCNGTFLDCNQAEGIYELPTYLPGETKLDISVRKGEDIIKRLSIFLVEDFNLQYRNLLLFDGFGYRQTNLDKNSDGVAGALVHNVDCPDFNFNTCLPILGKQRILFVGKEPGQVAIFPEESLPVDWLPVWAISKGRRRGQVMFCGTNLGESEPILSTCKNRKKLQKWKEILWHERKNISPPTQQSVRALWKKFQQEAEHVKA